MIFFDLDGTLLDHEGAEDIAARAFCRAHAATLGEPDAAFVVRWRALTEKHFNRFLAGEISHAAQRRERVRELFGAAGATLADEEVDARFAQYFTTYRAHWQPFDDVAATLDALEAGGWRLGVITNGSTAVQTDKLRALSLSGRFDVVVTPEMCGRAKPSAEIFLDAARRARLAVEQCVYVGDSLETDARAARAAGMRGVWLDRAGRTVADADVEVISTLRGITSILGQSARD